MITKATHKQKKPSQRHTQGIVRVFSLHQLLTPDRGVKGRQNIGAKSAQNPGLPAVPGYWIVEPQRHTGGGPICWQNSSKKCLKPHHLEDHSSPQEQRAGFH